MISKREILVDAIIASVVGVFLAFFALRLVPMPNSLYGLGYIFAWICCSLVIFLCLLFIGQWKVPREYPEDHKKRNLEQYEIPEIEADSSPWMEKRVLNKKRHRQGESVFPIKNGLISSVLEDPILMTAAILGGLSILIIPTYALIDWNYSCEQELLTDLSTILLCLAPIFVSGVIAGALWGIAGKEIGNMFSNSASKGSTLVFVRIIGLILALIFIVFGSLVPSFFLVFRECGQTFS